MRRGLGHTRGHRCRAGVRAGPCGGATGNGRRKTKPRAAGKRNLTRPAPLVTATPNSRSPSSGPVPPAVTRAACPLLVTAPRSEPGVRRGRRCLSRSAWIGSPEYLVLAPPGREILPPLGLRSKRFYGGRGQRRGRGRGSHVLPRAGAGAALGSWLLQGTAPAGSSRSPPSPSAAGGWGASNQRGGRSSGISWGPQGQKQNPAGP